jgi:MarR family transcriptional regulator, organic hydroperoxide resistance regulator
MTASSHRIFFLLQRAAHSARSISDNLLVNELGVTTAQLAVMRLIDSDNEMTQRKIAQELQQNESAITAMVNRLIKAGFVKRKKSKVDLRSWTLSLTTQGDVMLGQGAALFSQINSKLDNAVGKQSMAELATMLEAISQLK